MMLIIIPTYTYNYKREQFILMLVIWQSVMIIMQFIEIIIDKVIIRRKINLQ